MKINIEMNKRLRIVMLVALVLVALSAQVYAHDLWLNLNDYAPVIGGHTRPVVYFGWGHKYPVDDMFDSGFLNKFQLIKSNGEVKDIKPGAGGFLATRLDIKEPGSYWVVAETFPGFYTLSQVGDRIAHLMKPKTGIENVLLSMQYQMFAKTLLNVDGAADNVTKPVGHILEIVPLQNPANLQVGDYLNVQVLFNGKPLPMIPYTRLEGTYNGFSTDGACAYSNWIMGGMARVKLIHSGQWMLKVGYTIPVDPELQDKCDELSYYATMSFAVQ